MKNKSRSLRPRLAKLLSSSVEIGKARKIEENQNDYFLIFRSVLIVQKERQVKKRVGSALKALKRVAENRRKVENSWKTSLPKTNAIFFLQ